MDCILMYYIDDYNVMIITIVKIIIIIIIIITIIIIISIIIINGCMCLIVFH